MRHCAECNNLVTTPKVKVTLKGQMLKCIFSCLLHNFEMTKTFLNGLEQITNNVKVIFNSDVKMSRLLEGFIITWLKRSSS